MRDLTAAEIDVVEGHLDRAGTPHDNIFRRMIAELRRRRKIAAPEKVAKVVTRSEMEFDKAALDKAIKRLVGF